MNAEHPPPAAASATPSPGDKPPVGPPAGPPGAVPAPEPGDELTPRQKKWLYYRRRAKEGLIFGLKALVVISLFVFVIFFNRIVHTVEPGQRGVKWLLLAGGTVLDESYGEGMRLTFPWDEFYIYDMRIQELRQETVIYANDGLEIRVISSTRFRPTQEYLPFLHVNVGPDYVEKIVKPEVVSTLRKVIGNFTPEMIYAKDEEGLLRDLGEVLREDLNGEYFEVREFLVTELRLPPTIETAIKDKLTEEQKMLSYRFRIEREKDERERRIIEAEGIRAFETISGVPILKWRGIEATEKLAESTNAKIILMGTGEGQLPVILNADVPAPKLPEPEASDAPSNGLRRDTPGETPDPPGTAGDADPERARPEAPRPPINEPAPAPRADDVPPPGAPMPGTPQPPAGSNRP